MDKSIGDTWGRALKINTTLVHLDLSNNLFTEETCKLIGKRLLKNNTLFGLHMVGNCCSMDSQGFIVIDEAVKSTFFQLQKSKEEETVKDSTQHVKGSPNRRIDPEISQSSRRDYLFHRMDGSNPVIQKWVPNKKPVQENCEPLLLAENNNQSHFTKLTLRHDVQTIQ